MRLDSQLAFVPVGAPLSCVGATGATFYGNTIDLLGNGVGTAPTSIIGNAALFGEDVGVGAGFLVPTLAVATGTAFATVDSATLNVQLQVAPDTAVTFQPGTWQTIVETGALTAAQLTAATVIARLDIAPVFPANERPRYMRLAFATPASEQFTTGTIAYATIVPMRDDQSNKQTPSNYVVA